MPVLDASFLIDLQLGRPEARKAFDRLESASLAVPYQAVLEFLVGVADPVAGLRGLRESYELVLPSEELLLESVRMYQAAAKKGRAPSWSDLGIAAVAILRGDLLVTADARDFRAMDVRCWDFRKEAEPPAVPDEPVRP